MVDGAYYRFAYRPIQLHERYRVFSQTPAHTRTEKPTRLVWWAFDGRLMDAYSDGHSAISVSLVQELVLRLATQS